MTNTMKALQSVTVGAGGVASVTFSDIANTYTDLVIKCSARTNGTNGTFFVNLNGDNVGTKSLRLYSQGTFVGNNVFDNSYFDYGNQSNTTANVFSNSELYIPNYAAQTHKSVLTDTMLEDNGNSNGIFLSAGKKSSTRSITSITIAPVIDTLIEQYSTFTLYGVFSIDTSIAPVVPTIGTATAGNTSCSVTFTGVSGAASYTMTSTPGNIAATGTTSPIVVSGLTNGTSYTFKVKANNPFGSSAESAASNSATPVTPVIPLLGAWTTAATTTPSSAGDGYYGVSLVSGEPRVFNFGGGRSTTSYYNNGQGGTWTTSGAARPVGQGLGSSSKVMTNSGLFYTYGGDTGDQTLVYSTQTGASWTQQASISYSAGWSDGTFFENSGNKYLIAACEYPSGTTAARTVVASNGSLSWSNISSYPVYASAVRFARLTSVAVGMGGFTSTSLSSRRADVYSYNASTGNWTSQTALPFTPGGGYIPAASVVGPADSRIYVGDGTSLWSRGDSSGTWRSETSTPNTWAQGWGTTTSTGAVYLQLSNAGNTFYQQLI